MNNTVQLGRNWWNTWQESSVNTRIFAAMVTVGGLTVLVKGAAAVKELVVAYQFGTSDALDAFLMAFLLPAFVIALVGGSLNAALMPTYIQLREHEGQEAAHRLFSSVMVWSTGLLIAITLVLAVTASYILPVLASGFSSEKLALTTSLYYALLPCLVLSGVALTWSGILNAQDRFALAAAVPIVTPVVIAVTLLILSKHLGIYALVVGTVSGLLVEAGLLGWWLGRQGISVLPRWGGVTPAVRQVWKQYVPMMAGSFLMGSTSLVEQSMAAMLGPGSVSALAYGSKVTALLLGIGSVAVSTAVLPHFSRMVTRGDWSGVRHTLLTYARLIVLITLPLTVVLIYFSEPVVRLLFQRGAFTEADTQLVAWVQALHTLQIPVFVLGILIVRLISALQANRILMWGAGINLLFNIAATYLLMKWLGVAGIALSTSLMYLLSTSFLLYMALRFMKRVTDKSTSTLLTEKSKS
jgi:putative peptidoglycan lipid II flippase